MRHLLEEKGNDFPRNACNDYLEGVSVIRQMTGAAELKEMCV